MLGRGQRNTDSIESIPNKFRQDEPMIGLKTALWRESTQGGQDGRREPDSGIGCTQDHRTRWTDDGWVEMDSFAPNTVQLMGRKRRGGGRSAVKRMADGAVLRRDNQWGIPQKRALFISDGPDSTTSGSDILEGHYPDVHGTRRPHDVHVAEELC